MKTKKVKISGLKPHPKNPNAHPAGQITELQSSLEQFDQVKNIVIWQGYIIAGHGLVTAAEKQGIEHLKAVDVSDWPEEKAIKLMIADNRLAEMSEINDAALTEVLKDFDSAMDIPGIDETYLDNIDLNPPDDKLPKKLNEDIEESYQILIECESETQQQSLLERFLKEKLKCRALIS